MNKLFRLLTKLGFWIWNRSRMILSVILVVLCVFVMKQNYDLKHRKVFNVWQESFDLGQIPNGIVVWKHGVVGTETNFANADSTSRYKLFDVGILTEYGVVHRIRVPYYVIGLFKGYINFRGEVKKKEPKKKPKPEFFTYPKGKKGNNEKII